MDMTRFWLTIQEAVEFMVRTIEDNAHGEFIPPMKAAKVVDVASVIAKLMGIESFEIDIIGIGKGEKMHEKLAPGVESNTCPQYERQELIELLEPVVDYILR
jgi:UDP-N-acetylglucosamine 4,6-dehydratase